MLVAALLLTGCQFGTSTTTPATTVSATPTQTPSGPDLTQPGQARAMVDRLLTAAGSRQLIQVELTKSDARISVLADGNPQTWAWRDDQVRQVDTDVLDVNQKTFAIEAFDISDLGGLFRQAALLSGSDSDQELQIVDSSARQVMMAVSTVPESKTVFFYPDGRPLPILDFTTESGITTGITDAIGDRLQAREIAVNSDLGAYIDYPGVPGKTVVRRLRTASVPTTIYERSDTTQLTTFAPGDVSPAAIWKVVSRELAAGRLVLGQPWSVRVDDREAAGEPRMHFTFPDGPLITDLAGTPIRQP